MDVGYYTNRMNKRMRKESIYICVCGEEREKYNRETAYQ